MSDLKKSIPIFLILSILLSLYMPIIGSQLYFRHDDAQILRWAKNHSEQALSIFNPKLWMDDFQRYHGVGGTYRPFQGLYIILLLRVFGPDPLPFQLINGLLIIGIFVFLYRTTELFTNQRAAFAGAVLFHLCFQSIMYGNFHVVVPFGFFFQLGCFYFAARGLLRSDRRSLLIALLFYIPATTRQTTPILLPALILVSFLSDWKTTFPGWKRKAIILLISIIPAVVIQFSVNAATATVINRGYTLGELGVFVFERFLFYVGILTTGLTGFIILFCLLCFIILRLLHRLHPSREENLSPWKWALLWIPGLAAILTMLIINIPAIAIPVFILSLGFICITYKTLRFAGVWFGLSFAVFCAIDYYISSYILEASFGLSIILGYTAFTFLNESWNRFGLRATLVQRKGLVFTLTGLLLLIGCLMAVTFRKPSVLWNKVEAVQVLIETNKNFEDLMISVVQECPENARLFKLSLVDMDLGPQDWRFWDLKERAGKIGVMNVREIRNMLKVLGRDDLRVMPSSVIDSVNPDAEKYFIVLNRYEKSIAEDRFTLKVWKQFKRPHTEAAIYRF